MLSSTTLIKSARALRPSKPTIKTNFTKFQTLKGTYNPLPCLRPLPGLPERLANVLPGHARTHTTKNTKSDKTHSSDNKTHKIEYSNTWKDTLIGVLGAGGAITVSIILNTFLLKALRPQLGAAHERRADQAVMFYVHGY
ncbi:hypothetical protein MBLNU457_5548t1 [Dothideomycetes sp. NU457]